MLKELITKLGSVKLEKDMFCLGEERYLLKKLEKYFL